MPRGLNLELLPPLPLSHARKNSRRPLLCAVLILPKAVDNHDVLLIAIAIYVPEDEGVANDIVREVRSLHLLLLILTNSCFRLPRRSQ
jgi:hypothetical protein